MDGKIASKNYFQPSNLIILNSYFNIHKNYTKPKAISWIIKFCSSIHKPQNCYCYEIFMRSGYNETNNIVVEMVEQTRSIIFLERNTFQRLFIWKIDFQSFEYKNSRLLLQYEHNKGLFINDVHFFWRRLWLTLPYRRVMCREGT